MKLMHLAIAALLAATVAPAAHAEELENPAEGAVRRVYNFYSIHKHKEEIHKQNFIETSREILAGVKSAYATEVDRGTTFKSNGREETAMWMGYLKRKNGGEYTLVVDTNGGNRLSPRYSLWVNDRQVIVAASQLTSVDLYLQPGYNKFLLIVDYVNFHDVRMSLKKKDSIKDPTQIGPGDFWHEDELDDEDED